MSTIQAVEGMIILEKPTTETATFKLRIPLLSKGRVHTFLAATETLTVAIKCYATGGENVLHAHQHEEHLFIVLHGKARFYDKNNIVAELGRNEGILIAKGWFYKFESCGKEPLVLLRIGAGEYASLQDRLQDRTTLDGHYLDGLSAENKHEDPLPIDGAYYE